jgi:pre-mRNA-splicing factor ATP-dependent RNA helicase DHX16
MALRVWVNDSLHGLLGYAEASLVDYVIALAKKAKDVPSLLRALEEQEVPMGAQTQSFATQLFQRIPRSGPVSMVSAFIFAHTVFLK